jgi:hypothetical protein
VARPVILTVRVVAAPSRAQNSHMPIPVACKCGQKFAAKDDLAGKATKCPKCGDVLRIPSPAQPAGNPAAAKPAGVARRAAPAQNPPATVGGSLADFLDEAGVKPVVEDTRPRCPNCKRPMEHEAVLCVACGFNVQTGRQIEGVGSDVPRDLYGLKDEGGHSTLALAALGKAQRTIKDDAREEYRIRTQGMPVWAIFIILSTAATFVASMSLGTVSQASFNTGIVLASTSFLVAMVSAILLLRLAFLESLQEGLLCLLVPFYQVYYAIKNWKPCRHLFMIQVPAWGAYGLGFTLILVASGIKI